MKTILTIGLSCLLSLTTLSQRLPSGTEVLQHLEQGVEGVHDYVVTLQADVHMERVRMPRATATMYFKKPDKVHFDSPGIAMMPREGIAFNSSAVLSQYSAETVGADTVDGVKNFKLQLAAKSAAARLRQLFIWVNPENWTISRLQTIPYEGRILTLEFSYGLQDGRYWMPDSLTARFGLLDGATSEVPPGDSASAPPSPLDQMQPRAPRSGSISIVYSNYRINVGLSDDIFKPSK